MKFNITISFISGETIFFRAVEYPQCKSVEKVRAHFNACIMFMNVGDRIVNKNNIETMKVVDYQDDLFDRKLEEYREKNPEYKLEDKEKLS